MKNQWIHKVTGYVRIKISGPYPELFINRCIDQKMYIWDIQHPGKEVLVCSVLLDEVSHLRKLARASDCKISFIDKKGLPFIINKLWRRNGLVFGAVAFLLSIFILSNMVWNIEIEGASPVVEHNLKQAVTEMGITRGAFQFRLPPPEDIQALITDQIQEATWIGVTKKGTTYHFQVVEKEIAERAPLEAPGHLVAARNAVIYDMFIEKGEPIVEINQVVQKGDLLVSGLVGQEEEEKQKVSANGSVVGEIWFKGEVEIPLARTLYVATGNQYRTHYLYLGNFALPIWGWNTPDYANIKVEKYKTSWKVINLSLPVNYGYRDTLEATEVDVETAIEEAINLGVEKGREELLPKFSEKAEIIGENVLHHEVEDGKVKVIIHYQIVDEIAVKQPIIQGD